LGQFLVTVSGILYFAHPRVGQVDDDPLHQPPEEHQQGRIIVEGTELANDLREVS